MDALLSDQFTKSVLQFIAIIKVMLDNPWLNNIERLCHCIIGFACTWRAK
ncbi:hypothetical protein KAM385_10720 [Aeromonas hydrophila]|nr:hypothetical protein KAM385_10720 [Aeromonas hydrophila]